LYQAVTLGSSIFLCPIKVLFPFFSCLFCLKADEVLVSVSLFWRGCPLFITEKAATAHAGVVVFWSKKSIRVNGQGSTGT
jgi:hypothetical protein